MVWRRTVRGTRLAAALLTLIVAVALAVGTTPAGSLPAVAAEDPGFAVVFPPNEPTGVSASGGDTTATVAWTPVNSTVPRPVFGYRIYVDGAGTPSTTVTGATSGSGVVTGLTNGTTYSFTVTAYGSGGESPPSSAATATPYGVPATPTDVTATGGNAAVTLSWTPVASTGGTPVTGYRIFVNGSGTAALTVSGATSTGGTVTALTNGTSYSFTVAAYGTGGQSALSPAESATPLAPPGAVADLGVSTGDGSLAVSWTALASTSAAPVDGYRLFVDGALTETVTGAASTTATLTGLANGTTYAITIAAYGDGGQGPTSLAVNGTPYAPPAAPTALAVTAGDTELVPTWTASDDTAAAPVSGYRVFVDGVLAATVAGVSTTTATLTGLTNGTAYDITVSALGPGGESAPTAAVSATPVGAPGTVSGLTATGGDTTIEVTWTPLTTTAAGPVTGYHVYLDGVFAVTVPDATSASTTLAGLTNGTTYTVTVAAYGDGGTGPFSSGVSATPYAAPATPADLAATAGDSELTLTWTEVTSTVEAPVDGYRLLLDGIVAATVTGGATTTETITGLANGTTYAVTIVAYGPGGDSPPSTPAVDATPVGPPATPTGLAAVPGATEVALSWDPSASTPAVPVDGYRIYQDGVQIAELTDPGDPTLTVTGLDSGTTYGFQVSAFGSAGESPLSAMVTVTPVAPPIAPDPAAATGGDAAVTVTWTVVGSTVEAPVTGYRVYVDGSPTAAVTVTDPLATSAEVTGLVNGVEVALEVTAFGPGGESARTTTVTATPYGRPATPADLVGVPGDEQVELSWTALVSTAETPVDGYRVYLDGDPTPLADLPGDSTATATMTGLTNGVEITLLLVGYGIGGESLVAASVTVIPFAGLTVGYPTLSALPGAVVSHAPSPFLGGYGPFDFTLDEPLPDGLTLDPVTGVVSGTMPLPPSTSGVVEIVSGFAHSCARLASGEVTCWGVNTQGQLGTGDTRWRGAMSGEMGVALPRVALGTDRTAVGLAAGTTHTCALLDDASVKCWGANGRGQLGLGDGRSRGDQPGELGDALAAVDLGSGRSAVAVRAGGAFTCALLDDATVKCWGSNQFGKLGVGAGGDRGDQPDELGDDLPAVDLGSGRTAVDLAVGANTACAVLDDATVKCWGANSYGALGQGDRRPRGDAAADLGDALEPVDLGPGAAVSAVTLGDEHVCALLVGGTVKCWGANHDGRLGTGKVGHRGLKPDDLGASLPAVAFPGGAAATSISAGPTHTCARLTGGAVACWGGNGAGALGVGDVRDRGIAGIHLGNALPTVALGTNRLALAVSAGHRMACALLDDATLRCWGDNSSGQLGLGDRRNRGDDPDELGDALPVVSLGPSEAREITREVTITDGSGQTATATLRVRWL